MKKSTSKKLRELKARKATLLGQASALTAAADGRDFSEEESTQFGELKAQIEGVNRQIEAEEFLVEQQRSIDLPGNVLFMGDNREQDDTRGFRTAGEFYRAVGQAGLGRGVDQRLQIGAAAPGTYGNESAGADGGFAIPPEFSREIWRLSLGEESLLPLTENTEITGNSMIFPKDETTPWGGSGVQMYWQAEAAQAGQSKPVIGTQTMVLHKLMGLVPMTNELIEDGFAAGSYLTPLLADRVTWKTNEAILFGTGVGQPLGCLTNAGSAGSPAIVQAKEAGQQTGTLAAANITKMVQRLLVGELKRSVWIATPDILSPLEALTVGQYPVYLPNTNLAESPYGMLKGRPLMLSEHAAAFSSQSDLSLVSLKGYRTITKAGGIQTDTSMHLFFDADAMAFRIRFRINGQPILSAPVVPPKSGNTRSHFVTLAAR